MAQATVVEGYFPLERGFLLHLKDFVSRCRHDEYHLQTPTTTQAHLDHHYLPGLGNQSRFFIGRLTEVGANTAPDTALRNLAVALPLSAIARLVSRPAFAPEVAVDQDTLNTLSNLTC